MVLSIFQLLRSLNPKMQVMTELILPQNMGYLMPVAPLRSVPSRRQPLLSPAFISGAVFVPQLIDDLMLSSYCNDAADRIILQLLHRWHLNSSGSDGLQVQLAQLQQQLQQHHQQPVLQQGSRSTGFNNSSSSGSGSGSSSSQGNGRVMQAVQQQKAANAAAAAAAGVAAGPPDVDVEMGFLDQHSSSGAAGQQQQQQQLAPSIHSSAGGPHGAAAAASAGVPTILQVRRLGK
jgi:hypothetical protein